MDEKKIYTVADVMKMLEISRSSAYRFIQDTYKTQSPFKVLKIGNNYRIPKTTFDSWLNGN